VGLAEWATPGWRAAAQAWAAERLEALGRMPCGPLEEVSLRPWSVVLRGVTDGEAVYFKANIPVLAHEPELIRVLCQIDSARVLPVLGDDAERGWMLCPDGGPTVRSMVRTPAELGLWEQALAAYAELQIASTDRVGDLLEAGAFDYRLDSLVELYPRLATERPEVAGHLPRYRELCARLAEIGLPDTIHHDDFHDANVFADGAGFRFFDWHEGSVAPPFFSLLIALRTVEARFCLDSGAPELERLRMAYLEPWQGYGSARDLRETLDLALRVGRLTRAASWRRILDGAGSSVPPEDETAVWDWLGEVLDGIKTPV
jgi:hypothetical protein